MIGAMDHNWPPFGEVPDLIIGMLIGIAIASPVLILIEVINWYRRKKDD